MSIKSTAIFDFLLKKFQKLIKFITQSYLFIISEFIFILKCLPNNYFFRWFAYKSLLSRFSVLISYNMWSSNHFSISSCFPRFLGSRVQGPGPGFRSSPFQRNSRTELFLSYAPHRIHYQLKIKCQLPCYVVNFYEKFYLYGNCKNKQKQPPRDVLKKRRSENMQHNLQESTHGEV